MLLRRSGIIRKSEKECYAFPGNAGWIKNDLPAGSRFLHDSVHHLDDPQSGSSFFMRYARKEAAGKGKRFPLYELLSTFYSPRTFYN